MKTTMMTYLAKHEPCGTSVVFTHEQAASTWLKRHVCPRGVRSAGSITTVVGMDPAFSVNPKLRLREARKRQERIEKHLG